MDLKTIIEKIARLVDPDEKMISITNIATLNDGDDFLELKSSITLSVVNIQEDKTLKNQSVYQKNTISNTIDKYAHPPKYLIVSILFVSYNKDQSQYLVGLEKLQSIIDFFQQNNSFYYHLSTNEVITFHTYDGKNETEKEEYSKITFLSVSLSMDQLNQMWSYLGSKYMPSVLYEMRVLPVQKNTIANKKAIEEIEISLWENNKNDPTGFLESVIHPNP
ncbi:Pvc16 family protein [Chryseobacterium kwangjuense]|uniref:Pvc16 family protein n=1 Tax=Chryseobacterium kwangjuense TaxID=267125 RepID=A0ABW9K2F8_9FLAO